MRSDILKVITDAESKAEDMLLSAKAEANRLVKDNEERIEREREKFLSTQKRNFAKAIQKLDDNCHEVYSEKLKEYDGKVQALKDNADKHMDDCIKILVEDVLSL